MNLSPLFTNPAVTAQSSRATALQNSFRSHIHLFWNQIPLLIIKRLISFNVNAYNSMIRLKFLSYNLDLFHIEFVKGDIQMF